ncbi:MAG: DUF2085 domain-containing protein [bacterium]|nr:DUF2085 domain-containing protein [bacterium]
MHDLAKTVFSHLCHQQEGRSWIPGGESLALCHRCAGVYIGAAFMPLLLPVMRFRPTRGILALHVVFLLQMVVTGHHLVPQTPAIRTLSGQAFIAGALYLLWQSIQRVRPTLQAGGSPKAYLVALAACAVLLQVLVHLPLPALASVLDTVALAGLAVIATSAVAAITALFIGRKPTADS